MRTRSDQAQPVSAVPVLAEPVPAELARDLIAWFRRNARDLPWRDRPLGVKRDPYRVLVSETMLQQTQASRVAERFEAFMRAFPDVGSLARASEDRVLEQWSGLGYYQRARRLQAAARALVEQYGGEWPTTPEELATLPGVGRYTAGAIASMAFGVRTALADGNVARVLLRVNGRDGSLNEPATMRWVWEEASVLVEATHVRTPVALLNEGLMELGATICTPRNPQCGACPWQGGCVAHKQGRELEIPSPKKAAEKKVLWCAVLVEVDERGRRLVERRPGVGLWGGLWQAPTIESAKRLSSQKLATALGLSQRPKRIESFSFATTHRDVRFELWASSEVPPPREGLHWKSPAQLRRLGLSTPQRRILLGEQVKKVWNRAPAK